MRVLGIETSCDETAAAVLQDGREILSNAISSQIPIHNLYGGVVPELAGRAHIEKIHEVIQQALSEAATTLQDIDLIAVTQGPGLVCSLLVGLTAAKGMAYALEKPLVGVNHLEGHLLAIFLQEEVEFPFMALIVSGGHTDLCRVDGFGQYRILGRTRDDAAGECFDKVAKMMGLGYPGGPVIDRLASQGEPKAHAFPRAWLEKGSLDFSFSGLKTSVKYRIDKSRNQEDYRDEDVAASFQEAVVEVLVSKLMSACERENISRVVITGGVAANSQLRERVRSVAEEKGLQSHIPARSLCTDNAAMIACAGYHRYMHLPESVGNSKILDAHANLPL